MADPCVLNVSGTGSSVLSLLRSRKLLWKYWRHKHRVRKLNKKMKLFWVIKIIKMLKKKKKASSDSESLVSLFPLFTALGWGILLKTRRNLQGTEMVMTKFLGSRAGPVNLDTIIALHLRRQQSDLDFHPPLPQSRWMDGQAHVVGAAENVC